MCDCAALQSTVKGPGLKGVSYSMDIASVFDFLDPPAPLSVPKDRTPSPPVNPSNVMNSSSSSPMPSALAPSQSRQQEGSNGEEAIENPFAGLLESITSEAAPDKSSEVPDQFLQVAFIIWLVHPSTLDVPMQACNSALMQLCPRIDFLPVHCLICQVTRPQHHHSQKQQAKDHLMLECMLLTLRNPYCIWPGCLHGLDLTRCNHFGCNGQLAACLQNAMAGIVADYKCLVFAEG